MPWSVRTVDDLAFQWQKSVDLFSQENKNNRLYSLKYEDLILDPESELRHLCCFFEEPYSPFMLDYWKNADALCSG
jgi:hypothetical protein